MHQYPHIDSVYKRDPVTNKFLVGQFSQPEFEYLRDKPWAWTEKIDGTNIRVMWRPINPGNGDGEVTFGGKTDNAQIPAKLVTALQGLFTPKKFFDACLEEPVCLYGEGYGAGIQKGGGNYRPDQSFILFDVKIGHWWLTRENVEDIANKLGINVVPRLYEHMTLNDMIEFVENRAENPPQTSLIGGVAPIEGWVGEPLIPLFNRKGGRVITKVKYKDFADLRKVK